MEKLSLSGTSKHSTDDSMRGLSAIFVDGDEVFVDNGAIHAKSRVERNIRWEKNLAHVQNPRHLWGLWVTLHRFDGGVQGYHGAMPFELWIDGAAGTGFKSLAEQVNGMEKAVKGRVEIQSMPREVRRQISQFLQSVRPELWEHAGSGFREAFAES